MELKMDTNKAEGNVVELAGKVQDSAGALMGDTATQAAGKARELGGKAQKLYADTAGIVRDQTTESPFVALALVGAVGFLLGAMWAKGDSGGGRSYPTYRGDDY
jgi:uncharacterized protein YjbJ (UPF0337 family)